MNTKTLKKIKNNNSFVYIDITKKNIDKTKIRSNPTLRRSRDIQRESDGAPSNAR